MNRIVAAVAVIAVIGALLWFLVFRERERTAPPSTGSGSAAASSKTTTAEAPDPAAQPAAIAGSATPKMKAEKLSRARRDALLAQIRDARAKKPAASPPPSAGGAPPAAPTIDKAYIKAAVQEIFPLLLECYTSGLDRDPKLGNGSVVVDFTIEGEQAVGGVVGESAIVPDKTEIADAEFRQCIQETMYALAIDPPPDGGVVRVTYPFMFTNNE